jgi:hypothetical protein
MKELVFGEYRALNKNNLHHNNYYIAVIIK